MTYGYRLTPEWQAQLAYRYAERIDDTGVARSNSVFSLGGVRHGHIAMKVMGRRALITGVGPSARTIGADFEPGLRLSFSSHVVPGLIAALDTAMIMSVALVSFFALVGQYVEDVSYYGAAIAFVWITTILLLHFAGLYQLEAILRPLAFSDKILIAFATTFLFLLAAAFSLKVSATFSRVWVASFGAAACSATMLARFFASRVVAHLASRGVFTRNVVIAGAGDQVRRLLAHMDTSQPQFIRVLGIFSDEPSAAVITSADTRSLAVSTISRRTCAPTRWTTSSLRSRGRPTSRS